MRLLYVDPQSYSNLAKYDVEYLRSLKKIASSAEVHFLCSDLLDRETPNGIIVTPVFHYNRSRWSSIKLLSYLLSMLRILVAGLRNSGCVYHFQWVKFAPVDLLVIRILRRFAEAKIVLTAHNAVPHGAESGKHRILGYVYRTVDCIVVHHLDTAAEISRRFSVDGGKIRILRHGLIDLERKGDPRYESKLREFAASHDTCFVFFGRGSHYKGLDLLLDAWIQVITATQASAGLIVIGAIDTDLKAVATQAANKVPGSLLLIDERVSEADLYIAATLSNAVILPHRRISQSGVLLSVLGLEIPVIVAPLAGLTEPLESAPVGWTFDGTAEGLACRLGLLIDNPAKLSEVKNNRQAWRTVNDAYDWNAIAAEGLRVYEGLGAGSTPR